MFLTKKRKIIQYSNFILFIGEKIVNDVQEFFLGPKGLNTRYLLIFQLVVLLFDQVLVELLWSNISQTWVK